MPGATTTSTASNAVAPAKFTSGLRHGAMQPTSATAKGRADTASRTLILRRAATIAETRSATALHVVATLLLPNDDQAPRARLTLGLQPLPRVLLALRRALNEHGSQVLAVICRAQLAVPLQDGRTALALLLAIRLRRRAVDEFGNVGVKEEVAASLPRAPNGPSALLDPPHDVSPEASPAEAVHATFADVVPTFVGHPCVPGRLGGNLQADGALLPRRAQGSQLHCT
eukprot:CAMPEP_0176107400 /NCGR_PEP_ID=MMETSP0120_2-20121206/53902_1 /TAXON_ID=160619 /ORGANISM="Kryptoperidinium foliaceum, Strain CCMP 1326" /LENGTH=227 /DNA_ID=CAMNT_0017441537 /DNA_START=182 /DNA_END=863 /DNA_ORIENTATION=-